MGIKREEIGVVVSDKMTKTVVVAIDRRVQHPVYKKYLKRTRRFKAHDEENNCKIGDVVRLIHTRPLSAQKAWLVVGILKKANKA